jgi:vacuolar-type H+-ATPase subunit F/Vma7
MKTTRREAGAMEGAVAVLADAQLVDAMRLAGVERTRTLRAEPEAAESVEETLREWLADESLGVVIIGADHAALAAEAISRIRHGRRLSPVIVQVPSRDGAWESDATAYYQVLSREFLGLEVVLRDGEDGAQGAQEEHLAEGAENGNPAESAEKGKV